MKKIAFAALAFIALSVVGGTRVIAQSAAPQPAAGGSADAVSDQQMALLRKDIRTIKKQLIAANLTLTDGQATKFWPVYEQYSAEFGKINETRSAVIKEYADGYGQLSDDHADNLIRRWLDTDIGSTASPEVCTDLSQGAAWKASGDLPSAGPPHQHDDRRPAYFAAAPGAEPELIVPFFASRH